MGGRIAVIGSLMMDLVTYVDRMPAWGETLEAPTFEMGHGGKGANQAVAAAKLGTDVLMIGKVGQDAFGDPTIRNLASHGVDCRHVTAVPGRSSGVASITVDASGENAILIVTGANADLSPADIDAAADDLKGCDLILLQLEVPVETVYAAIAFGREHGIRTLLNPAPARRDLDPDRVRHATFLVPNETELVILADRPAGNQAEIEAAARHLIAQGAECVIVTMGSRGALLVTAGEAVKIAPVPVTPVDTTGAGDAFIGSFAHFLVGGDAVPDALRKAAVYAADSITRRGTQKSYPTAASFEAVLAAHERARLLTETEAGRTGE